MTRSQRNRQNRRSCGKRNFASQEEAEAIIPAIEILNDSKGQSKKNKGLHAYECPHCECWHIGHKQAFYWAQKRTA